MPQTSGLSKVTSAGRKYRREQAVRDAALAELQEAIREAAREEGTARTAIIEAASVGRQTVYDAIGSRTKVVPR